MLSVVDPADRVACSLHSHRPGAPICTDRRRLTASIHLFLVYFWGSGMTREAGRDLVTLTVLAAVFDKAYFPGVYLPTGDLETERIVEATRGKPLYQPEPDRHPEAYQNTCDIWGGMADYAPHHPPIVGGNCPRCGEFDFDLSLEWSKIKSPDQMVLLSAWVREQNAAGRPDLRGPGFAALVVFLFGRTRVRGG